MKTKFLIAAAAALATTPAMAQDGASFTGAHAEAIVGYDSLDTGVSGADNIDGVVYGANLGYDFSLGGVIAGVEAELTDSSGDKYGVNVKRDLYAGARIGVPMGSALLYAKAGYTNLRLGQTGFGSANGDGVRVGAGVEYALSGNLFLKGEYRYSNYEAGVSRHQVVGGLGIRF